jgi:hypothetical protein
MSARSALVRALPCIACAIEDVYQPNRTTEHHLNAGGHAGQARRGDEFSIPLCQWHHQGYALPRMSRDAMTGLYGPSLAHDSKMFRFTYGSDDQLLALTNGKLARLMQESA